MFNLRQIQVPILCRHKILKNRDNILSTSVIGLYHWKHIFFEVFIPKIVYFLFKGDLQEDINVFLIKARWFLQDIFFWYSILTTDKITFFFDSQVAGGLSTGLSVRETVIKETNEEANLPKHIATQMKPAGCVR